MLAKRNCLALDEGQECIGRVEPSEGGKEKNIEMFFLPRLLRSRQGGWMLYCRDLFSEPRCV